MDLVVPKKDLFHLLDRCHGVADKKSAVPALANILLAAEGRTVRAAATDLYLGMSGSCEAEILTPGTIAVPAKDLFERVRAMPEGPVQVTTSDGAKVTVKAVGKALRYTLHGLPGNDFPLLPKPKPETPVLELPVELLAMLLARTHFSISTDETRAHVNSLLFEWSGERVRTVSTDGHRLSKMEATLSGSKHQTTMLLPLKAVTELRRLLDQARAGKVATLTLCEQAPNAYFTIAGMQFSVKVVDAVFPPYQQVIPASADHQARVTRAPFQEALKAIQLAASDRTGGVKIQAVKGALRITSESPESGAAFDEVTAEYTGPDLQFGCNARYMLDVLGAIDDEDVTLGFTGELDPVLVRPATETADASYVACIMPMRI